MSTASKTWHSTSCVLPLGCRTRPSPTISAVPERSLNSYILGVLIVIEAKYRRWCKFYYNKQVASAVAKDGFNCD